MARYERERPSALTPAEPQQAHALPTRRDVLEGLGAALLAGGAGGFAAAAPAPQALGPQAFREVENVWIPMSDGTRLAARLWLPQNAEHQPVPAIFNYCPYFARIFTRPGDDARFPYFASHGYAAVRVDIRGSGNSEGRPLDEYARQEQDDGLEIIAWIARQPWCNGKVGMEGISWSGFNSLQVAARRPPALKAIITHCSTDDRYADDAHFKGGCIIHDMFNWGTAFLGFQGQAPDPAIVGERWKELWLERLRAVEFNLGQWMTHQHRDAFWKHASVCEDYGAIRCPVYAIGGWVDGYKNAVFRLLAGLEVPRKGLVGPWTHIYPHQGVPGPAIGYLAEARRWWDHWLKGRDTGIMREPMLRVWMQEDVARPDVASVPGRWVAETAWPSPRTAERKLFVTARRALDEAADGDARFELSSAQTVGAASGNWCPSGAGAAEDLSIELALDQRLDDAGSLCFDSEPLGEPFEILGSPRVTLGLASDKPVAAVAVRLNEVLPSGESMRVTYGLLNLCHREGSEQPRALTSGERYTIRIPLDHAAHRFRSGSVVRLAVSTAYWPMMLPAPEPVRLTVYSGPSFLALPVRPPRREDDALRPFGPPFVPDVAVSSVSATPGRRIVERDVGRRRQVILHRVGDGVARIEAIDTEIIGSNSMRCEIADDDPASATIEYEFVLGWQRGEIAPKAIARSRLQTTTTEFVITGELVAHDGTAEVFERSWTRRVGRNLV